jgi:hypothetical protein
LKANVLENSRRLTGTPATRQRYLFLVLVQAHLLSDKPKQDIHVEALPEKQEQWLFSNHERSRLIKSSPSMITEECVRERRYGIAFIIFLLIGLISPGASFSHSVTLESIGIRGGLSGPPLFGKNHPHQFQQYDVMATLGLPWKWEWDSGWQVRMNLIVSTGALRSAGETNFIGTVVPALTLGRHDERLALTIGGGAAFLSDHNWSGQNYGGAVQYVGTFGISSRIYGPIGIRYWLQHYSDATMYGSGDSSRGADMHLFEVNYRF